MIQQVSKIFGSLEKSLPVQKLENWYAKDPANRLAALTITSIVIKDGIGCVKYVHQSYNNKKIPEDKRKFVTALDLTNGILMIATQIGMFLAIRKISEPLFNKLFKQSFSPEAIKLAKSRERINLQKAGKPSRKINIAKDLDKGRKSSLDIFKFIVDTAAATIVGKRIIVPLIATPLAQKVEKRMNKDGTKSAQENTEPQQVGSKLDITSAPTMIDTNLLHQFRHALGYQTNN